MGEAGRGLGAGQGGVVVRWELGAVVRWLGAEGFTTAHLAPPVVEVVEGGERWTVEVVAGPRMGERLGFEVVGGVVTAPDGARFARPRHRRS